MLSWPFISTPRVRLRPAQITDLSAIESALADSRFPPELPLARMLRDAQLAPWLARLTADLVCPRLWATTTLDNDTCIGTVALVEENSPKTWWLSYWLSPVEWRKGLAFEAVGALLSSAARLSTYEQVVAAVAETNSPSIHLLERLGFTMTPPTGIRQVIPEGHITMRLSLRVPGDA